MKKFQSDKTVHNSNVDVVLKRSKSAVTEIVGTLLLLSIVISLSTIVSIIALNTTFSSLTTPVPAVSLIGTIDENIITGDDQVIIQHCGGNQLRLDTNVTFLIAGDEYCFTAGELMNDEDKADGVWNIGEHVNFTYGNLYDLQVEFLVIDSELNTVLVKSIIREGETGTEPYVITLDATNITATSATLNLYYNFRFHDVEGVQNVSFAYRKIEPVVGERITLGPYSVSGNTTGYYDERISIEGNTRYQFFARLEYNVSGGPEIELKTGNNKTFWSLDWIVGRWSFNETSGPDVYDISRYDNDGILKKNEIIGPQRVIVPPGLSNRSLSFDGINDYVFVPTSESLTLTDEITIDLWVNPLEDSEGIVGEINELNVSKFGDREFDCFEPDFIHVSGNIYAIACRNENYKGYVITVNISETGEIRANETTCFIDTLNFESRSTFEPEIIRLNNNKNIFVIVYRNTAKNIASITTVEIEDDGNITGVNSTFDLEGLNFEGPEIIHVNNDVYALAYTGNLGYGNITTVNISDTGIVTEVIENFTFEIAKLSEISILQRNIEIDKVVYAIVGRDGDNDGMLVTFNISNEGNIDFSPIQNVNYKNFDNNNAKWPKIINVTGDIYAIFYGIGDGQEFKGKVRTMIISSTGVITRPPFEGRILFFEESSEYHEPEIKKINGNFYAIVYSGPNFDGILKTVQINDTGTINQSFLQSFSFESNFAYESTIINVSSNIFAIAYRDNSKDGRLITIEIAGNGSINQTIKDNYELGIFNCNEPDFIHVANDIYAIAYRGIDSYGYLRTVRVADNGSLNNSFIDYLMFESSSCYEPNITHVTGEVYAIVYDNRLFGGGVLQTVNITAQGNISIGTGSLQFDNTYAGSPMIIPVDGNYFAIAYEGEKNGSLTTVEIFPNGSINQSIIDFFNFSEGLSTDPHIIHIKDDFYAITFGDEKELVGKVITLEIFNNGTFNQSIINTSNFYAGTIYYSEMIHIKNDIYAIVFQGFNRGIVTTINISDNGVIGGIIDSENYLVFSWFQTTDTSIIHVVDDIYLIGYSCYQTLYQTGVLKTLRVGDTGEISLFSDDSYNFPHYGDDYLFQPRILHVIDKTFVIACKSGSENGYLITVEIDLIGSTRGVINKPEIYDINANGTHIFATIATDSATKTLMGEITNGWNYFALVYNESIGMKLYRNQTGTVVEIASENLNGEMLIKDADLYFCLNSAGGYLGGYNCILDEITIYSKALDVIELQESYDKYVP